MNEHGCISVKFYLQKQTTGWIWLMGHSLLTLILNYSLLEGKGSTHLALQYLAQCLDI